MMRGTLLVSLWFLEVIDVISPGPAWLCAKVTGERCS